MLNIKGSVRSRPYYDIKSIGIRISTVFVFLYLQVFVVAFENDDIDKEGIQRKRAVFVSRIETE